MRSWWEGCLWAPVRMLFTSLCHTAPPGLLGLVLEAPTLQHTSSLPFQRLTATRTQCPRACLPGSAHRPSPRCLGRDPAGSSAVPKPGSSLSYKVERTWKLKQEKQLRGQRAPGAARERQPGQSDHIIYWFSWEDIYGSEKNLSISQDTVRLFRGSPSTTKLTQRQLPGSGREVPDDRMWASQLVFPKRLAGCGVHRNCISFHRREGGTPLKGRVLLRAIGPATPSEPAELSQGLSQPVSAPGSDSSSQAQDILRNKGN